MEYSRKEVNRAGKVLIDDSALLEEKREALQVLNYWRSLHSYPINTFQANLRKQLKKGGFDTAIVAQRLKRVPSIVNKLRRIPSMKLARMHDIGGLRVILNTINQNNSFQECFKLCRFRHELKSEYNYILNPKESGYRGIHLVYKYQNSRVPLYNDLLVEIQLRTKLQHAWATAVETMGTFLRYSLKSSEGPEEWLEFFSLTSSIFALLEKTPPLEKYKNLKINDKVSLLKSMDDELRVTKKLEAFGHTIQAIEKRQMRYKYYILILRPDENRVTIHGYHSDAIEQAVEDYLDFEEQFGEQHVDQVVLVSATSFKNLKSAYPNYFLDTRAFKQKIDSLYVNYS